MTLYSEYVERAQNGAQITDTIHMRPIAVRENGSLLAMIQDFANGDASFPHAVERAPLRVRRANDGGGRMYPVPGDDTKYIELGPPKIQIGGVWTQVSLGTPSRVGNTLTWTRPQTLTTFTHGGHFADLRIELLGGFVPESNLIAFPVAIQGLTRSGLNILNGSTIVTRLRPFVMYDAANPLDRRPITHSFVNIGGQPHVRLTLPNLAGMVRPVIDPTLEAQPDETAGKDSWLWGTAGQLDTNRDGDAFLDCGGSGSTDDRRTILQFDVSSIPATSTVSSATLSLWLHTDLDPLNSRTGRAYRIRAARDWVEAQVTWNSYKTSNLWTTAGCSDTTNDREATEIGTASFSTADVAGQQYDFTLTPSAVEDWVDGTLTNNGMLVKMDTETDDLYRLGSSGYATASQRPKLTVVYTELPAAPSNLSVVLL